MKLCLLPYNVPRAWPRQRLIEVSRRLGFAALELRCQRGHADGFELETPKEERRRVRDLVQDAYLDLAGLGTSVRFESPDPTERQRQLDRVERFLELGADVGALRECSSEAWRRLVTVYLSRG